jgi:hypothetical protein
VDASQKIYNKGLDTLHGLQSRWRRSVGWDWIIELQCRVGCISLQMSTLELGNSKKMTKETGDTDLQ